MAEFTVSEVIPACRSFGAGRKLDIIHQKKMKGDIHPVR